MVRKLFILLSFLLISSLTISAQVNAQGKNPIGHWKFEAPNAPEGYNSGSITVISAGDKLAATMKFDSLDYAFNAEKVKLVIDSLFISILLEDQVINISLNVEDSSKMTGKAVYSDGTVPLTLKKELDLTEGSK